MTLRTIENVHRRYVIGVSLLILAAMFLFNHIYGFFGHYGYDDMTYAGLANRVISGNFSLGNDHANYRWVVIFLTATSYKFFGINDHSSALMPMLFTLLTAWLVSRCTENKWQAALSIFLFGLHSWTLFYADKIMPDIYVAFFFFAAIYIIYEQKRNKNSSYLKGFLLAVSLFLAILSKETIILTIPVFGYLMMADILQKRNRGFWISTIAGLTFILILYLIFIKIETGHFLQRYYAIKLQSYFNPCSYDQLPVSETIRRISSALWMVFVRSGLFLLIIFGGVALAERRFKGLVRILELGDFFPMVFILTLLCCNFMSTSPSHYIPMCEDPRHYLFMVPVAAVMAGDGWMAFLRNPKKYFWVLIAFGICFYISYKGDFENSLYTYLPLLIITSIALLMAVIVPKQFFSKNILSAMLTVVLSISIVGALIAQAEQSMIYARKVGYKSQKKLVLKNLKGRQDNIIVLTNTVERNYGPYYLSYDTSHVIFRSYEDIRTKDILKDRKIYLLLDGFSNMMSGKTWEDMPHYAQDTKNYKLIDKVGGAELYELSADDVVLH